MSNEEKRIKQAHTIERKKMEKIVDEVVKRLEEEKRTSSDIQECIHNKKYSLDNDLSNNYKPCVYAVNKNENEVSYDNQPCLYVVDCEKEELPEMLSILEKIN